MNHRVRSVLAAVLIMVVSILLPSDFQFENTDRFVKEQSSSIQMTAQYTDGIEKKVLHDNYPRLENPREAISAQSAEQRKSTQRLPMELLLFLIFSFVGSPISVGYTNKVGYTIFGVFADESPVRLI